MADCCLIKKVATVEVYENKNEVRAYGFMAGDRNTPVMEVRFKHLWGESNLSTCKLRWIIVDDVGSLLVGEVPIQSDNTALINLPNELFTGDRRMKVQLTLASCDGERILNLQQFTDLKVINNLAANEVVEPVYQILINAIYDESQKYLKELETSYTQKYGSLDSLYKSARASLEQYLITAENGGNAEFLQGYSPAHFQKVENTINDLIASKKYKVGDVVQVLGYYSAGDGSNHKRKIETTDSGFGVLLSNGLYANILIENGELNLLHLGVEVETQYNWLDNVDFTKARRNWEKLNKVARLIDTTYMTRLFTKIIIPRGDIIIDKTLHFIRPNTSGSAFSIEGFGGGHSAFGLNGSTIVCVRRENFDSEPIGVVFSGMNSSNLRDFCITSKSSKVGKFNGVKVAAVIERDTTWKYAQLNRYDNVSFINSCKLYEADYVTEIDYAQLNNGLGQIGFYSNKQEDSTFINCMFDGGENGSGIVGTVDNYCNIKTSVTFDEDVYTGYSSANNMLIKCHIYGGVAPVVLDGCWNWNFKGYLNCYNVSTSNVLKLVGKGSHTIKIDEMQVEQSHTFLGIDTRDNSNWFTYNIVVGNGTFSLPTGSDVVKIYPNCDSKYIRELDFSTADYGGNFNSYLNDLRVARSYVKNVKFKDEDGSVVTKIINIPNGQIENLAFETFKAGFEMKDLKSKIMGDYKNIELLGQGSKVVENLTINQKSNSSWEIINSSNIIINNQDEVEVYNNGVSSRGYRATVIAYAIGNCLFCELSVYIPDNLDTKLHLTFGDMNFTNELNFRYVNNIIFQDGNQRVGAFLNGRLQFDLSGVIGWSKINFMANGEINKTSSLVQADENHLLVAEYNDNKKKMQQLDTPYHASNMQKLGILDSYHNYLTELHEYEKSQNVQSDSEVMNLNILQPPVIPTGVEEYAKEYNLI